MRISYRTQQLYRNAFRALWLLLLVVILIVLCWALWLRRYIVYTDAGAEVDFSLSQQFPQGQTGPQDSSVLTPEIYFQETEPERPPVEQTDFRGYYVSLEELQNERDTVLSRILALPEGTPVMLDVKGFWGYYYYGSSLGATSKSFDRETMDAFFSTVNSCGVYAIARLPAFRDYDFAINNTSCGLPVKQGYLWVDDDNCYWLDPADDLVIGHLAEICRELRDLGFDEVAFTDFRFPDSDEIVYDGDRQEAVYKAASTLVSACARTDFVVSFISTDPTFQLPAGNCRLYLLDVAAVDVQTVLLMMPDGVMERTVFFAQSNDTRFEVCGVIRPLEMAD